MKTISFVVGCILATSLLAGCEKNTISLTSYDQVSDQALVKVNVFSMYRANPLVQLKVNGTRISNAITAATPFPGGGLNTGGLSTTDYLSLQPGASTVSFTIPKIGTNQDSVQLGSASVNLTSATKQSVYFTDTAASITSVVVLDTLARPDSGYAKYKFVNLMPDLPSADLYIGTTKVASAIPYKGVSPSFTVPTNNASSTWGLRTAGGTTNLITYASASTLGNQRVYTVIARGYNAVTATSDPRSRRISLIYNL